MSGGSLFKEGGKQMGSWVRTALTTTSTPFSMLVRPIKLATHVAKVVVSSVVVLKVAVSFVARNRASLPSLHS